MLFLIILSLGSIGLIVLGKSTLKTLQTIEEPDILESTLKRTVGTKSPKVAGYIARGSIYLGIFSILLLIFFMVGLPLLE